MAKKPSDQKVDSKKKPASKITKPTVIAKPSDHSPGPVLHALLIGCDFYFPNETVEGTYGSLQGCVRDVSKVEAFLRDRMGLIDERLVKLTSTDVHQAQPAEPPEKRPTYENIIKGFRQITTGASPGDHVYVHYSGHGGRCPTIIPKVKGKNGLDETLVPVDIGDPKTRYVRDVEIAKLLKEMAEKKLLVTVIFDSCHSGGATRGLLLANPTPLDGPVALRGVNFVDKTKRPTESLVGSLAELAATVSPDEGKSRGMVAVAATSGQIVLAACKPDELAHEFAFESTAREGALTHWFLTAVAHAPQDLTFRSVIDLVHGQVHGQFPSQTPMLFGDPDRRVLDEIVITSPPAIPVTGVVKNSNTFQVRTGQAGLARAGMELILYPAGTTTFSSANRLGVARITTLGAAESSAELTTTFGTKKLKVGDLAVLAGAPQPLIRKVRVERFDGKPVQPADKALLMVEQALPGQSWVELSTSPSEAVDFVLSTSRDGKTFVIADPGGSPISIHPDLPTGTPDSAERVVARLVHLAKYRAVLSFENADPLTPLRGKLITTLFKTPKGFQLGDPLQLIPFTTESNQVKSGEWLVLSVTNRSSTVLNAVTLDLAPDWSVSGTHPDEPFHSIDPNGEPWLLPLQASLPPGMEIGTDVLKVIATIDPPPTYSTLMLPALGQPIPSNRGGTKGPSNPLDQLLDALSAENPTRQVSTISQPTRGWITSQVEIQVRK